MLILGLPNSPSKFGLKFPEHITLTIADSDPKMISRRKMSQLLTLTLFAQGQNNPVISLKIPDEELDLFYLYFEKV